MRLFAIAASMLLISACGTPFEFNDEISEAKWRTPGISVSPLFVAELKERFNKAAELLGSDKSFDELRIVIKSEARENDASRWSFTPPNRIEISFLTSRLYVDWWNAALAFLEDESSAPAFAPGIVVRQTMPDLEAVFEETKAMSELSYGRFADLAIVLMPKTFECPYYDNGCSGEFVTPNTIHANHLPQVFCHEVVHYLLYVNTGSGDSDHENSLFEKCERRF